MDTVESLKHLLLDTGAEWVLWLLGALSVASVAVALERWWVTRQARGDLHALADGFQKGLAGPGLSEALPWLEYSGSAAARVAASGLRLADHGSASASRAMASRATLEREGLERRLAFLGTLGNNAPFIGLFGTVIGVIQAFEELGRGAAGQAAAAASGQVASGAVMSAIAEALVATAVGIAVALPAVAAYNTLQRRVDHVLAGSEVLSNLVLAYLESGDVTVPPESPGGDGKGEPSGPLRLATTRS